MKKVWVLAATILVLTTLRPAQAAAETGRLKCGVVTEPLDWNKQDLHGNLAPLDMEICRAVATALFGGPDRMDTQAYNTEQDGLTGLAKGQSDIVVGMTPDAVSAGARHVRFSLPIFLDGQGFMVHRAEGIAKLADITGKKLCYIEDTDNDRIVLSALYAAGIRPIPFGFQEEGEMDAAIMDRHCQVTSALISKLAEARATIRNARDYVFLPDRLTMLPVTVATDARDPRLGAVVDYTISVLLQAELLGVTQAGARDAPHSEDPRRQRLLGEDFATAQGLGLAHDWSRRVVAAVGNYAEVYDRTVGPGTAFDLARGANALWSQGGAMVGLPLQ